MVESNGSFRVLFVGCAGTGAGLSAASQCVPGAASTNKYAQVDIVAQFKTDSFLNYIYYTQFETLSPAAASDEIQTGGPNNYTGCWQYEKQRNAVGQVNQNNCYDIEFAPADVVKGPMYTDDWIESCGSPIFGVAANKDPIYTQGNLGCPTGTNGQGQTTFSNSTPVFSSPPQQPTGLQPPATNSALASDATYVFSGATDIVLNGAYVHGDQSGDRQRHAPDQREHGHLGADEQRDR